MYKGKVKRQEGSQEGQQLLSVINDTGEAYLIVFIDTDDEFIISVKLSMMNALPDNIKYKKILDLAGFCKTRTNFQCKPACGIVRFQAKRT